MHLYHREILRCIFLVFMASAFMTAAQPAPHPWRPGRPGPRHARLRGGAGDLDPDPGTAADSPAQLITTTNQLPAPRPSRGTRRGRRSRRRGHRGGARWRWPGAGLRSGELLICEINVQSLKPHLPDFRLVVDQYDVVALCETWLSPHVTQRLLTVDGYQLFRCDRPVTSGLPRGRGGVAVLARQCLSVQVIDVPVMGGASNSETIWTTVGNSTSRLLTLCSFYRHPTQTVAQIAADLDDLEHQIQYVLAAYPGTVAIAGDHNLNQLKTSCVHARRFVDLLNVHEFRLCNASLPTYHPANSVIDAIAVRPASRVLRSGVTHCFFSPHNFSRTIVSVQTSD